MLRRSQRRHPETVDIHRRVGSIIFQTAHHRFGLLTAEYQPFNQFPRQQLGALDEALADSRAQQELEPKKSKTGLALGLLKEYAPAVVRDTWCSMEAKWAAKAAAKESQWICENVFLSKVLEQLHMAGFELVSQ